MKSPILSATFISIVCSVSFIIGFVVNDHYRPNNNKKVIIETVVETSKFQKLIENYSAIIQTEILIKELNEISNMDGVDELSEKQRKRILFEISQFRNTYNEIVNLATRPELLDEFVSEVNKLERKHNTNMQ